jgi:FAD/FMN-containing dehydrogenase
MWRDYFDTASALTSPGSPVLHNPGALLVLVEALGSDIDADAAHFEACMAEALSLGDGVDAVIAQSLADAQKLWALREASGESAKTIAPWVGFDVSVPLQAMARLVDAVRQGVHALDSQLSTQTYGHLGDGNLHFVVGPLHEEAPSSAVKHLVHRTAGLLGGSVSGEHGIGVLKKLYLGMTRSPDEIEVMRALKSTLDPLGLLNRDRVFDCTPP